MVEPLRVVGERGDSALGHVGADRPDHLDRGVDVEAGARHDGGIVQPFAGSPPAAKIDGPQHAAILRRCPAPAREYLSGTGDPPCYSRRSADEKGDDLGRASAAPSCGPPSASGCTPPRSGPRSPPSSVGSGLSVGQTMVLSLVMFSGASQFAFVGVIAAGGSPFAAVPAALLLGVRNAFYGVPMSEILHPRGLRRLITAHFVIDETTAMAVGQETPAGKRYAFWSTGLILCALLAARQPGRRAGRQGDRPEDVRAGRRLSRDLPGVDVAGLEAGRGALGRGDRRRRSPWPWCRSHRPACR